MQALRAGKGNSRPGYFLHFSAHSRQVPEPGGLRDVARYLTITDLQQARKLEGEMLRIFKAWCNMKDRG
jgi:hypothetical protein